MNNSTYSRFLTNYFLDVNECTEEAHNCHVMSNATCSDTDGSFYCNCTEGFEGNGTHCNGTVLLLISVMCLTVPLL